MNNKWKNQKDLIMDKLLYTQRIHMNVECSNLPCRFCICLFEFQDIYRVHGNKIKRNWKCRIKYKRSTFGKIEEKIDKRIF